MPTIHPVTKRRKALGLRQYQLAELAGLAQPTICCIEKGSRRHSRLDTIEKLADGLGIKPEELATELMEWRRDNRKSAQE